MRTNSFISSSKLILKIALLAAILLPVYFHLSDLYTETSEKNVTNRWNSQRFADLYALPADSLDLVFIGSSHSYCTFDPAVFDAELGVTSIQMGMPLQFPDSTYYTLREVLNYQKPRLAVMEVYWGVMDKPFDVKQADALFLSMKNDELIRDYIRNVFPPNEKVKYNIPIVRYQPDFLKFSNRELAAAVEERYGVSVEGEIRSDGEYRNRGYIWSDLTIEPAKMGGRNQFNNFDGRKWNFDKTQKKYLGMIIDLCKNEGIGLMFVTAPVAPVSMERIKNYGAVHDRVREFADANGIKYLDYNTEFIVPGELFADGDFRDDAHLNDAGAKKACGVLIDWLRENNAIFN